MAVSFSVADPGAPAVDHPTVSVLVDRCAGCQECLVRCPTGALGLAANTWTITADDTLCVGCRQCVRTCPFSAIRVEGPRLEGERTPLVTVTPQRLVGSLDETRCGIATLAQARAEASRCLACPDPTCVRGCPAHNDIPGFIAAIREGDLGRAQAVLARTSFLPDVCSRVCDQSLQCEGACTWSLSGGTPVAIGALERFVTDSSPVPPVTVESTEGRDLRVAVVGAGPAGIGAAGELVRAGAAVTVLEARDRPGGLLDWGIPPFTLPRQVSGRPWQTLMDAGVELRCGVTVTAADVDELLATHDAVILAHGAGVPLRLPVEGGDLAGVCDATEFLRDATGALERRAPLPALTARRSGEPPRVLVVGAGNTAMDVARLARRHGAEAVCVDWLDRRFAPVRPDELAEAEEEGVEIRFTTTIDHLEGRAGRLSAAVLSRTEQKDGRHLPKVVRRGVERMEIDLVVMAMGYRVDPSLNGAAPVRRVATGLPPRDIQASGLLAGGTPPFARHQPVGMLAMGRDVGTVFAALGTRDRVHVAGDALVGPSTVVEAMVHGREAARAAMEHGRRRAGRDDRLPLRVLIAYESRGGRTEAVARTLATEVENRGATVSCRPLTGVGIGDLAAADVVVLGTWVEGLVVTRVAAARATRRWVDALPGLGATRLALFCTYAVSPRNALSALADRVAAKGGRVIGEVAIGRHGSTAAVTALADRVLAVRS